MSNIFVRIISEFKDTGFKKANKSTAHLGKQFNALRTSARRAFIAIAGISALKRSVTAFAAADAASRNLAKSLDNLGLKYEGIGVDKFIEDLEKSTAVAKEKLYPAFRTLANATLSVSKSQGILSTALDIAAGTGSDVETVATALARAYNGNYTSLGKLQNGYTAAELKAMGFQKSLEALQNEFSGQAASDADSYQGKITKLGLAVGDAAEAVGEGLVDAFTALGGGNYDKGLELLASAGERLGNAFRSAAKFISIAKFALTGGFFKSKREIEAFALAINSAFAPDDPAKSRALARERSKYLKEEQKKTEKIRKDREKIAKALEKEKQAAKIVANAQKTFDLERIEIEAALRGKINDVEEYRLKLQRAILNENVDNIIKYTGLLKEAETQAAELADLLARLPEMAENPFTDWPAVIERIQYLLKELDWQIPIDVLFAEKGLKLDQDMMTVTKLDRMNVNANNVYINGQLSTQFSGFPWSTSKTVTPEAATLASAIAEADAAAAEAEATAAEADSALAVLESEMALAEVASILSNLPLAPGGYGVGDVRMRDNAIVNVTVNNAGSVISETDLVNQIRDKLYELQSNGQQLVFKRTIL